MFNILGFNFLFDAYALNPRPTNIEPLTTAVVSNGVFDEIEISSQVDATTIDTEIPTSLGPYDVLLCNFNGNISGGSLDYYDFDTFKVKRREFGTFDWVTLFELPVSEIYFTKYDWYARTNTTYEYAFVPITGGVEGNYSVTSVDSKFYKIYLCDSEKIYSLDAGITFGNILKSNKTNIFEPLMGKYPIIVSNAELDYKSGTLSGTVITPSEDATKIWDLNNNIKLQNSLLDFLVNKKAKIYKDWMGNSYLILIVEDVSLAPNNNVNGRLADISFSFVEIGNAENQNDLYENGLIDI